MPTERFQPGFRKYGPGVKQLHWYDGNRMPLCGNAGRIPGESHRVHSDTININDVCVDCLVDVVKVFGKGNVP